MQLIKLVCFTCLSIKTIPKIFARFFFGYALSTTFKLIWASYDAFSPDNDGNNDIACLHKFVRSIKLTGWLLGHYRQGDNDGCPLIYY